VRIVLVHAILHINIRVPEHKLTPCVDFYCHVLGLSVGPRPPFESRGFWLYADGVPVVHLVQASAMETAPDVSHGRSALDHVAFACSGLPAALDRLQQHGIPYTMSKVPVLNQTQVSAQDPAGIGIELSFAAAETVAANQPGIRDGPDT
jgi:catechol 2,3-dioxygenase-like lactoylglutathione lyase family enzyme